MLRFRIPYPLALMTIYIICFFSTEYVIIWSTLILIFLIILKVKLHVCPALTLVLVFFGINALSILPRIFVGDFTSILGLMYVAPVITFIVTFLLFSRLRKDEFYLFLLVIYFLCIVSGVHAVFFSSSYEALGGVRSAGYIFKRNSLYSDVESTALAIGIAFLYLAQFKTKTFIFGKFLDFYITLFIVLTTVSKSIIPFYPFFILLILNYRSLFGLITFLLISVVFTYTAYELGSNFFDYYADNGWSSFSERTRKWTHLLQQKKSLFDMIAGNGMRYINIQGPYAGPHSFYVGLFLELGTLSIVAISCILLAVWTTFKGGITGASALLLFFLAGVSSEVVYNRFFLFCLAISIVLITSGTKKELNDAN